MKNNIDKMEQPISLKCKFSKGCSYIYSLFQTCQVNKKECKRLRKWKLHFNIDEKSWQSYCSITFNSTIDDLRWFQYRILNRILFTNDLLFKLNLVEDDLCSFCYKHTEKH